jgi:copper transport protein
VTLRRLLALVLLAAGWLVAVAGPAAAHARLVESEPAASAVVAVAPTQVVLRFEDAVEAGLGGLEVLDESGRQVLASGLEVVGGQPEVVAAALPALADGVYVVEWRVTSADGHPVNGAFPFRVGEGTAPAPTGPVSGAAGSAGLETAVGVAKWTGYVGLALLVGGAGFVVLAWPAGAGWWPARRVAWFGWGLSLMATLGAIGLQGPYASGLPAGRALDPDLWRDVLQTRFGQAHVLRLALLLLALPLLAVLLRGVTRAWAVTGAVVATGLAFSVAAAGHGATGRLPGLGLLAGTAHVSGMALWLGGLVLLGFVVLVPPVARAAGAAVREGTGGQDTAPASAPGACTGEAESGEPGSGKPESGVTAATVDESAMTEVGVGGSGSAGALLVTVRRFSALALVSVAVVAVSGAVQSWRMVGGPGDLAGSTYGRTLLVKLAVVAVLLGLAWLSRRSVHRRWPAVTSLRRSVLAEVAVAAAVLVVTAALVQTSPQAGAAPREPFTASLVQGNVVADVSVSPAAVGEAELHLLVTLPGGSLRRAQGAEVRLTLPARELGPVPVPLQDEGPNHWSSYGVQLPYEGTWDLEIRVTTADGALVRFTTPLEVSG